MGGDPPKKVEANVDVVLNVHRGLGDCESVTFFNGGEGFWARLTFACLAANVRTYASIPQRMKKFCEVPNRHSSKAKINSFRGNIHPLISKLYGGVRVARNFLRCHFSCLVFCSLEVNFYVSHLSQFSFDSYYPDATLQHLPNAAVRIAELTNPSLLYESWQVDQQ